MAQAPAKAPLPRSSMALTSVLLGESEAVQATTRLS